MTLQIDPNFDLLSLDNGSLKTANVNKVNL